MMRGSALNRMIGLISEYSDGIELLDACRLPSRADVVGPRTLLTARIVVPNSVRVAMLRRGPHYDPIKVALCDLDSGLRLCRQQGAATTKLRQIGEVPGGQWFARPVLAVLIEAQNYRIASAHIGSAHLDHGHNMISRGLESIADPFRVQLARVRTYKSIAGPGVVYVLARSESAVDRYERWRHRLRRGDRRGPGLQQDGVFPTVDCDDAILRSLSRRSEAEKKQDSKIDEGP